MYQDSSKQERLDNMARYMHEADDFILPIMRKSVLRTSPTKSNDRPHGDLCSERHKLSKTVAIATCSTSEQLTNLPLASKASNAANEAGKAPNETSNSLRYRVIH